MTGSGNGKQVNFFRYYEMLLGFTELLDVSPSFTTRFGLGDGNWVLPSFTGFANVSTEILTRFTRVPCFIPRSVDTNGPHSTSSDWSSAYPTRTNVPEKKEKPHLNPVPTRWKAVETTTSFPFFSKKKAFDEDVLLGEWRARPWRSLRNLTAEKKPSHSKTR